jgi:N-dimethylarginine dimethylaminohydrolase
MSQHPFLLMTDPTAFEVCYQINPWMRPEAWRSDHAEAALNASAALRAALVSAGFHVETLGAVRGLPDLVFPANAAVVLNGRVLAARFRHPERQGEEAVFLSAFEALKRRGVVSDIVRPPEGVIQEGAGDCIWDADRRLFWAGYGPRSTRSSVSVIEQTFGQPVVALELASDRYYHLDTCFCPLAGGRLLYYPPAFTPAAQAAIRARVPISQRIAATDAEAEAFCVNAVNLDQRIVMARAPASLTRKLETLGYAVTQVDLAPFILSGGGAYCMTLRLDRTSQPRRQMLAAE